ncbi:hypothetical protein ACLOJK_008368 [Asimina triloba]
MQKYPVLLSPLRYVGEEVYGTAEHNARSVWVTEVRHFSMAVVCIHIFSLLTRLRCADHLNERMFLVPESAPCQLVEANPSHMTPTTYYSLYGHVVKMAREELKGANSVPGVEATLWQIPETLPDRVLEKMKAPTKEKDVAVIRPEQLAEADGFIFGFPSRFGMMGAQFIAFFESTYDLWASQKLAGKPAGVFWSTGFHGGGQENSALTTITQLAHHGILFVPLGYTFGSGMFEIDEVKGGSSYGAGTYAGDGSREPTQLELQQAFYQGKYISEIAKKLKVQSH